MEDEQLLAAWVAGDAVAGNELMRRHYLAVRRFFDLKVPAASEDLTQRTLLACVEQHDRFRGQASFRAYLFGIARNQMLMYLRQKDRFQKMLEFREAQGPDTIVTPSGVVAMREEQRLLLRAMEALKTDLQIAMQLHYWEGMSSAEIAGVLEIPESTVTTRLQRARDRIREMVRTTPKPHVAESLARDIDGWARSLVGRGAPGSDSGIAGW
jgi:RNA polymerase sigma-70 factor (ECF subfamily)